MSQKQIFYEGFNSLIRLVNQGVRARLGSIAPAENDDDAVPLDQLMDILSGFSPGGGATIEITRAQAATIDTDNGGDGAWIDGQSYRITNPLAPLNNVVLRAVKNGSGFARLAMYGVASVATSSGFVLVKCGYDPLTNTIFHIHEPTYNVKISGNSTYSVIPLGDPLYSNIDFTDVITSITTPASSGLTDVTAKNGTINISSSSISRTSLENVSVTLSASAALSKCFFVGNGETIVFPAGYTATGKTFISGVQSTFEWNLDLSNGAIYNATGGTSGQGLLTIPANTGWVGKFILFNDYAVIENIDNLPTWTPDIIIQADLATTFVGFQLNLLDIKLGTAVATSVVATALINNLGLGLRTFDAYGSAFDITGYAVLTRQGDYNIYLDGKSIATT